MEQSEYKVYGNKLILKNGEYVEFDYPIKEKETLMVDGIIIVVLEKPPKVVYNENVFAVNTMGKIIWRVAFKKEQLFSEGESCPFVGASINKDGHLVLFNWCDTAFIVNPKTGTIIDRYLTR